jgi:hypothetical protein
VNEPNRNGEHEESRVVEEAQVVARGRASRTPFVALGGVAIIAWTVAGLLTVALLALMWLLY